MVLEPSPIFGPFAPASERSEPLKSSRKGRATVLDTTLNFAAALAGLIAAWRWYQTTTIRPPTELPYGGPTTIDTGPLVAFIKEIAR